MKAEILGLSNRFDAAIATFDRAIALDPNHAAAHVGRVRKLILIGRAADAVAPVEKTFWFAYVDLASAYAWRGQKVDAAVAELLKLRPGYTVQMLAEEGSGASEPLPR